MFDIARTTQRLRSFKEASSAWKMDLQQSERYFYGYVFVPCCPEDYHHNQLQGLQAIPGSYTGSNLKYDAVLPEQNEQQPAHTPQNTSHGRESDCRVPSLPAIYRQLPGACGVSRHKVGLKRLPASSFFGGK